MEYRRNDHLRIISQIGLVVPNMEQAVEKMKKVFGVEPDEYGTTPPKGKYYYGKEEDFAGKLAFYHFANLDLELIEPIGGKNIWSDFLNEGRKGLHHIRFSVDCFDETVKEMNARGYPTAMQGESVRQVEGLKWAYFDTFPDVDFVIEIFNDLEFAQD